MYFTNALFVKTAVLHSEENTGLRYKRQGYLRCGSQFGEYPCLVTNIQDTTIFAKTYCELYTLSSTKLWLFLERWTEYRNELGWQFLHPSTQSRMGTRGSSGKGLPDRRLKI